MSDCLSKALELAESGHPVFPCRTEGELAKKPYTDHGFQDSSTDPEEIREWWSRWPDAAIGYPTGIKYDVLDIDIKESNGVSALNFLKSFGLLSGHVKSVKTPSKGIHLYFPADIDRPLSNKQVASAGIDVRGLGGYVIIPPSVIDGNPYTLQCELDRDGSPMPWEMMEPLLVSTEKLSPPTHETATSGGEQSLEALQVWVSRLKPGERNAGLFWACCRAVERGDDPEQLADAAYSCGLSGSEIRSTIRSAKRAAQGEASK